ncbi:MAG: L,D-transpeptidase family protein [Proteobacteria bacterium]|nr:L,D-transpeptidase family protein [Pseudomonadota bacterium]
MIARSALFLLLLSGPAALAQTGSPAPELEPTVVRPAPEAPEPAPPPLPPMPALKSAQTARLLSLLEAAPSHGLPAPRLGGLRERLQSGERREAEAELIALVVSHARALRGHRVNPTSVSSLWAVAPPPYDAARELQAALTGDRLDAWAAALPPPYAGYRALQGAYSRYRQVADAGGWPTLSATGTSIRPGVADPRVPTLRKRLAAEGYAVGSGSGTMYDKALADAVRRFQSRRGLGADGVIGNGALAELNVSAETRADQIAANLERWRWIPRQLPNHRIEVNLPTAMLDYYRDGGIPSTMKVAVGAVKHQTPMMTADISSIVLNPPWNVPSSIVKNEIAPRLKRDPGYLARQGLKVVGRYESGLPMLQQAAGPRSALGRVKFDSPNEFAVFLHDTPSRAGFSQADRLLSHGCVRLERPLELARLVLEGTPEWTPERMQAAVDSGKTVRVSLPERVPMYLFYWTSFVDSKGGVYFWDDIYGWDKRLTAALDNAPVQMAAN